MCRAEYTLPALFQSQAIRCLILSGYDDDPNSWMHRAIDSWSSDHPEGYSSMYVHCTYLVPSGRVIVSDLYILFSLFWLIIYQSTSNGILLFDQSDRICSLSCCRLDSSGLYFCWFQSCYYYLVYWLINYWLDCF